MGLIQNLQDRGLPAFEVLQTHAGRGLADTWLYNLACAGNLVLYDDPELRDADASASGKELDGNRMFIKKSGRGKIDLLIALSNALYGIMAVPERTEVVYLPQRIGPQW